MKNYPVIFVLFCLATIGALGAADMFGYGIAGWMGSNSARSASRFASHYHK
ncbi:MULTISPECIES: hypothetical protein [unclassified Asticcacaulis]|uniref:hypothetical protein n=1 Tax=unclassified Asticcacaulis TaxID=2628350 RepID=UPI0003C3F849|nr:MULTISPECIES: hypothetical protein [unclassified Asticcacaulis]ESQ82426.1 hypothetical protein AEAC466_17550 [Asticcacaulis sp. AC466]MDV6333249.1 hypothetical protein [Asticcacaulis sp. 201]